MTLLYNYEKRTLENVPEAEVTDLVASGVYAPRKGVKMPVIAPDGEVGNIPSENAQKAFLQGFKYQTREDSAARAQAGIEAARAQAFGESTSTAVAAGALRGATFGLSDVAMRAIGGEETAAGLQATRELQPIASTIGEVGGAVAGMALPVSPVGAVAKLGEKGARAVAGTERIGALAAKGTAGEIAAEIMAKGAGSAIEGAFYGAGELLSEAALGDPNLTAQNAAVVFGGNVLLGGALGGLVPGAATGVVKLKDKLGDILVNEMNVPAKAMDAFGKLISFAKITDADQQAALKELAEPTAAGRARREFVFDLVSNPHKASDYAVNAVSDLINTGKTEAALLGDMRESARDVLAGVKYSKGDKLTEVDSITSKLINSIETASNKSRRYVGGAAEDLTAVLDELRNKANAAGSLADMHKAVHDSRMLLDDLFEGVRKAETPEAINTKKLIKTARDEMTATLHSEQMFPGLGRNFGYADAAFAEYLTAAKEFRKAFEKKVAAKGGYAYEVGRSKSAQLIKNPLSDIAQEKQAVFDRVADSVQNLSSASSMIANDPAALGALSRQVEAIKANLDKVQQARQAAILLDRLEAKTGRSMLASAVGYGAGTAAQELGVIDVPGAGAMGMIGGALLANPKTVMTYLMRLERGNMAAANAIEEASRKYLGAKIPASVSGALGAVYSGRKQGISELMREVPRGDDDRHLDDHDVIKTKLSPLENIEQMDGVVKNQNPLLDDIAPSVYAETVNAKQRAVAFLRTKFPQDSDSLFAGKSVMSASQRIKLDRYVAASMNPSELLHEMSEGNVRPETVEAVRAVYPEVYAQVQKSITEVLTDPALQRSLPWKKKNELAKVLGVPTTESLQNIDMLQQAWKIVPEENPTQVRPKAPASFMAPSEAIQSRMSS